MQTRGGHPERAFEPRVVPQPVGAAWMERERYTRTYSACTFDRSKARPPSPLEPPPALVPLLGAEVAREVHGIAVRLCCAPTEDRQEALSREERGGGRLAAS